MSGQKPDHPDISLPMLLEAIIAAEQRSELVDRDSLIKENPRHADALRGFFAGLDSTELVAAERSLLSPDLKPSWWKRWSLGLQLAFAPLCCFQCLIWTAEFISRWDIGSLRVLVGLFFMAVMFIGIPLSIYDVSYHILGRAQRRGQPIIDRP
jgi:hypothetical protein